MNGRVSNSVYALATVVIGLSVWLVSPALSLAFSSAPRTVPEEELSTQAAQVSRPDQHHDELPNLLVIGDSISIRYTEPLRQRLMKHYNVYHLPVNAQGTTYAKKHLKTWLDEADAWDVIVFNWGSWDVAQVSVESYQANLHALVKQLSKTQAQLYFTRTVPSPEGLRLAGSSFSDYNEALRKYDRAALKVMKKHKVPVVDLQAAMLHHLKSFHRQTSALEIEPSGFQDLADAIAKAVVQPAENKKQGVVEKDFEFHMIVFGLQDGPGNTIDRSHTFATFVKSKDHVVVQQVTISWISQNLVINFGDTHPQRGTNMTLPQTLKWGERHGSRLSAWGPYKIDRELFVRADKRAKYLESGTPQYIVLDQYWRRKNRAFTCIHALSDINGPLVTRTKHGDEASEAVVGHFKHWIQGRERNNHWLMSALDLPKHRPKKNR